MNGMGQRFDWTDSTVLNSFIWAVAAVLVLGSVVWAIALTSIRTNAQSQGEITARLKAGYSEQMMCTTMERVWTKK